MTYCPLCSHEIKVFPVFDEHSGFFVTHKKTVLIKTPARQKIFKLLLKNYGKPVSFEQFAIVIWGYEDGPKTEELVIRQHIYNLREETKGTGYAIKTAWGVGYKLVAGEYVKQLYKFKDKK